MKLRVEPVKLAVPRQELRMRPVGLDRRRLELARGIDDRLDTLAVVDLAVHDNLEIIPEADQPPIKYPMRRT